MQKKTLVITALTAVAALALLAWAFAPRPLEVELASATLGRFETTVDEDARTRLRERYVVSAPLAGRLARIALREGDVVDAGAVLARLAPVLSPLLDERSAREQAARVEATQAGVERAGAGAERARVALAQARSDLQRTEQLARQGFVAPTQLDTQRLAEQAAQQELNVALQTRHVAEHELQTARAALAAVQMPRQGTMPADFPVRSPVAGRVLKVAQPSEATVALGTPLLEIGDLSRLEIVAELLTADALQTRPGAAVRIERWGGPTLAGRVRRVEPAAFTKVSALGVEEQRVNLLIDITSPAAQWAALGDGFRVGVRIVTLDVERALQVPVSAVFPLPLGAPTQAAPSSTPATTAATDGPRMAVFVADGGRARLQPVLLGARNGQTAWIRDGLAAGAQVIVYPPAAVHDGARIRPRSV